MGLELCSMDSNSSGLCPVGYGCMWSSSCPNLRTSLCSGHPWEQCNHEPIWVRLGIVYGRGYFGVPPGGAGTPPPPFV
jgi:hypothetical protein